jgi:hypothetical protein
VDVLWDASFEGLELASTPVKYALSKIPRVPKDIVEARWFTISELSKEANELIQNTRTAQAQMVQDAASTKDFLSKLAPEDSKILVRALGGDLEGQNGGLFDTAPINSLPTHLKGIYEQFRNLIDSNADELVRLGVLDEKSKIQDYLKRYYKQYLDGTNGKGSAAFSKFYKRKDLDLETRLGLGMIEDASFVISKTLLEQKQLMHKARLLQKIATTYGSDVELEGYVRISNDTAPGGTVKKWGALAGKYVPREVKVELLSANMMADEIGAFERVLYPVVDFLKVTLTVKNPVTHLYNIGSNIMLSGIKGSLPNVARLLYMRHKNRAQFDALVHRANALGLNSQLADMEGFQIDLSADGKRANVAKTLVKNLFMTADSKAGKGVRHLYDWEDKIFKLAAFDVNLRKGMSEKAAYADATAALVDYSKPRPATVKVLDKSGLMPFLTYQFHSTPAVAKLMLQNPVKAAMFGGGVAALRMSAWQNDDEESFLPRWAKDKLNLFGVAEWVEVADGWFLNAGRLIPGTKFEFELGGFWKGILNILSGSSARGDYKLNGEHDDTVDVATTRTLKLLENYTPAIAPTGRIGQNMIHIGLAELGVVDPKKNYYREDMTVKETALRALGVRRFNTKSEVDKNLRFLVGEWGAGNVSKEAMEKKFNAVIKAAKAHNIAVDHKRIRAALKRAVAARKADE